MLGKKQHLKSLCAFCFFFLFFFLSHIVTKVRLVISIMNSRLINISVTSGGLERGEEESNTPIAVFFLVASVTAGLC